MNEKNYKKRLDFQEKMISRKNEQIEALELEIESLKLKLEEKDEIINSVTPLRNELAENVKQVKEYKKQYDTLIQDLKKMKEIINLTVYKGRWKLIKFLIK